LKTDLKQITQSNKNTIIIYDYLLKYNYKLLFNYNNTTLDLSYWTFHSDDYLKNTYNLLCNLINLPEKNNVTSLVLSHFSGLYVGMLRKNFPDLSKIYIVNDDRKYFFDQQYSFLYDANNTFSPLTLYLNNNIKNKEQFKKYYKK
jgi:hypothetical protein